MDSWDQVISLSDVGETLLLDFLLPLTLEVGWVLEPGVLEEVLEGVFSLSIEDTYFFGIIWLERNDGWKLIFRYRNVFFFFFL